MSEIKWIKITTSIFDDEAIKIIEQMPEGDALLVIWLKLLIQAGIINDSGLIYFKKDIPYTEDMLAIIFHKPVTLIRLALTTFVKFGMIEIADNQTILIRNWEKHQNADALELYNKSAKERMRRYRERQKQKILSQNSDISQKNDDVTFPLRNTLRHVTGIEEEEDKEEDKEREYINSSSSINVGEQNFFEEEENIKILSDEEEELLKSFAERPDRIIYNYKSWKDTVIKNGDYKRIIKEELANKKKKEDVPPRPSRPECQIYTPEIVQQPEMTAEEKEAFLQKMRKKAGINNRKKGEIKK